MYKQKKYGMLDRHMRVDTDRYAVLAKYVRTGAESACPYPPADLHLVSLKHKVGPVYAHA